MTALYIALAAAAVLVLLLLYLVFPAVRKHKDRELLRNLHIAHRGLHGIIDNTPENSLAAFREAVLLGYAIENDIHLTADGEVVVFHDDTLKRMCGVEGRVEDKTLAELKKLRIAGTQEQIPTLKECLDVVNGRVPLLVEFKSYSLANAKALCAAADKILSQYNGKYFVQSFFPPVLYWYRRHRKEVCRGQLSTAFFGGPIQKRMLGLLLFNFVSRPDFVSYEHTYSDNISRRIVTLLGAFPVGWTFRSQKDIDHHRRDFKTYIFENFIPKK